MPFTCCLAKKRFTQFKSAISQRGTVQNTPRVFVQDVANNDLKCASLNDLDEVIWSVDLRGLYHAKPGMHNLVGYWTNSSLVNAHARSCLATPARFSFFRNQSSLAALDEMVAM